MGGPEHCLVMRRKIFPFGKLAPTLKLVSPGVAEKSAALRAVPLHLHRTFCKIVKEDVRKSQKVEETIFAKIVKKEIPAKIIFEDEQVLAFHDVAPAAPNHLLVIPKRPLGGIGDAKEEDKELLGHLFYTASKV